MYPRFSFQVFLQFFIRLIGILFFLISFAYFFSVSYGQLISQYIETNSGSTPKGIEIWNNTGSNIVFSGANSLQVYQGTNGGACGSIVTVNSGTLEAGKVWVIGTSDLTNFATTNGTSLSGITTYNFAFNGDDALQLYLGGVLKDVFGTCGSDPGSAWTAGGVSTANNNISILSSVNSGTTANWTNPSLRFETTANGSTMTGFGNAPVSSCATPNALAFETQPSNVDQNTNMTAVQVKAICSGDGSTATSYTGPITITLNTPACGYSSQTVNAVNGIATFSTIQILRSPQTGLTFTATATGLTSTTSSTFNVTAPTGAPTTSIIIENNFSTTQDWNYSIGTPTSVGSGGSAGTDVVGIVTNAVNQVLSKSFSVSNGSGERGSRNTITFDNVTGLATYNSIDFTFNISSFGSGTGAGNDNNEDLTIEVSTNGGSTWTTILTQSGFSNRLFAQTATPVTALSLSNSTFTGSESAFKLTVNSISQFQFRMTATNNRTNENWAIDNVKLVGTTIPVGTPFNKPTANAVDDFSICNGETAQLSVDVTSFQVPLTYSWTNAAQLTSNSISNPIASPTGASQTFTVTVTDAHNCTATDAVTITKIGFGGTAGLWTGTVNTDWFNCRNWSDGQIPTATTDVTINQTASNACVIADEVATCRSLQILSNNGTHHDLTIETTGSLEVVNDVLINKTAGTGTTKLVLLNEAEFSCRNLTIQGYSAGAGNAKFEHEKNTTSALVRGNLIIQTGGELDMSDGDNGTQDGILQLRGNFTNNATEGDFKQSTSRVIFNGTTDQEINTNGFTEVFASITINKTGGNVVLLDPISIETEMNFTDGNLVSTATNLLIFNDNSIHVFTSNNSHVSGWVRKIGNDAFVFPVGSGTFFRPVSISNPGSTSDHFTATYILADPDGLYDDSQKDASLDHISSCEYWMLNRTNGSSNVKVTLSWNPSTTCGVTDPTSLRVARWNGSTWKNEGNEGTTGNADAGTILSNTITAFSPFTLASTIPGNPLPVELTAFSGVCEDKQKKFYWSTASEHNASHFMLQAANEDFEWKTVANLEAIGNSTQEQQYYQIIPTNENSYYRLVQVDFDGRTTEYTPIRLICQQDERIQVYPNPFQSLLQISGLPINQISTIEFIDATGKLILSTESDGKQSNMELETSQLNSGIYFLRITNVESKTYKILKIN